MHRTMRTPWMLCLALLLLAPTFASGYDPSTIVTPDKYFTVNGNSAFVVYPTNVTSRTPWVWYAPTVGGTPPYPDATTDWYFQRLLNAGIAIAGVNVGESYGSPDGRAIYSQFYTYATQHNLAPKALLLGQSRGGLMMFNWAEDPGNAQKVSAIVGIYPALDLTSYPGLSSSGLQSAYHMTQAQLQANLATINPISRLSSLQQGGIPIFSIAGDSDVIVPLAQNSQAALTLYTGMGGTMTLKVIPGYGHAEIPQYFQDADTLNFMLTHVNVVPEPSTGVLLVAGLLGLLAYAWRRWK
jgi:dipeptidyl aminopeptidase/acylaminoacyl peptidase